MEVLRKLLCIVISYIHKCVLIRLRALKSIGLGTLCCCTVKKNRLQASPYLGECKNLSQTSILLKYLGTSLGGCSDYLIELPIGVAPLGMLLSFTQIRPRP